MSDKYNPMSKEFQDEAKRLGITGRQLTEKYRKEGKSIEKENYKHGNSKPTYTKEQLINELRRYKKEEKSIPTMKDFNNNPNYPSYRTYQRVFGSWSNALKLVEMDVDSMVKNGVLLTSQQKARLGEIIIRDHFKQHPIDLAGENKNSPCDGICPNGKTYDVKSCALYDEGHYYFHTNNKYKEEIEIYYLLGFNEDWTKLNYGWRIPGEIAESDMFYVGVFRVERSKFDIYNIKEYDITDILREVLNKYDFFNNM